jgi:uncharacterized radical SAM superfamily Fe-S cluster-containing enzyme
MKTLGVTQSICSTCRELIPAKVITDGLDVYFEKFCLEHGQSRNLVQRDLDNYLKTQRYIKPAWVPDEFAGDPVVACPQGCGFCDRHEQHLCMPIVEITSRCDLTCPVCIVDAGLVHPDLLEIVDEALSHAEIVRVSISTNGLALLRQPNLLRRLCDRNVVISLQFDGFDDRTYEVLRGRKLLREKLEILDLLAETGISTSLTVTIAGGVNDGQFSRILEYLFSHQHVVSMMIQPISFAGRGANLAGKAGRLTIPDVIKLLDAAGDSRVSASDFVPLPCSHPLCFCLAYYLVLDDGGTVSLNRLVDASKMMDSLVNRTIFGLDSEEHENLKDMIYEMWSGSAGSAPDSDAVMKTLRGIMDEVCGSRFDPRKTFTVAERYIKSIFIHAFQDVETFDLSRVRRCCQAYPQPDGKLIPVCVHNVLGREKEKRD